MADSHARSLLKAISWRMTGTVDTFIVSFLVTHQVKTALSIGLVELITKTTIYYFHERAWNKVAFGKRKDVEDFSI